VTDLFADDATLIAGLQARDEAAFAFLLDRYHALLLRVARRFVSSDAVAEEVVSETWVGVIRGIDRFEGRSSVKTWLVRILSNQAITRGVREARSVPVSTLAAPEERHGGFDVDDFATGGRYPGHWRESGTVARWGSEPMDSTLARELRDVIGRATSSLPDAQREVFTLRDVEGWTSTEVADALEITAGNQRVLLHRARTRVRIEIDDYLALGHE